ncbi:mechanosensitive ion channel family protein [Clostridium felsineum]|uniref:Small-conductance mechanosensitive channel n=1 Tax=Clostridium felsineum TaxID=36839 RepID=A0A1S8LPS8_9CLOT|nr:mechanosensitive ion channel family protein [Clostridium felsineum]MCR3761133.1 mechanosensitive ion channel family protein [Clostridium felsineum]URZ02789.1 Small-conductance mechanosensitive channel [Clostridium felsineum]URZ08885.1 Small-conductance mechanosensitive channel [Clostridium felsineum]URZ09513.1 Small-conductance mechanosensitive channel [Clostridium felsineum]
MNLLKKINFDVETGKAQIQSLKFNVYDGFGIILRILIVIVLMYIIVKLVNKFIDKTLKKQEDFRFSLDKKRSKTIGAILKSVVKYCVYFFGITIILTLMFGSKLFSTVSLTFASIGGVALGFGSQNLVKDVVNGFFILFEDQYSVGDYITIDKSSGIVESIELRVTKIRSFKGDLHIIPNGKISEVTNHSRGPISINVNVSIAYEENIDNATKVINGACEKFSKDNEDVVESPKVVGITELASSGVNIRVSGKVKPMKQWSNENQLRKYVKEALDNAKIEIPYNKLQFVGGDKNE